MYDLTAIEAMTYHRSMLTDRVRTKTFLRAMLQTVKPGDIVLDLGSGTGLLAYFACMSGAKRVYAVEAGPIIELAKVLCRHNGFEDRIMFVNDWSTNIELPELVDVIVSETIGNVGFEEGILGWILDARERMLIEGGKIVPRSVELVVVPVEDAEDYGSVDSWSQDLHSLDFSPARSLAANNMQWADLPAQACLDEPKSLVCVDTIEATSADIRGEASFVARRGGLVHGIGAWFAAELAPGERISNGPPLRTPSWSQRLLPLERPLPVLEGDRLRVQIRTSHHATHWQWKVERGRWDSRARQDTLSGELRAPAHVLAPNHKPVRTEKANADLFILSAMDGATTVKEIARQVIEKFPAQFRTFEGALEHVYGFSEGLGRWADIAPT